MARDSDIKSGLWTVFHDYDRPWLTRAQILVEDQTSRFLIAWLAVLLGLTVPCVYVLCRRLCIAVLPQHWKTSTADESNVLFRYFEVPGDEDNPFKAARAIWRHAGEGEIALPTNSDVWPTFLNSLSRTGQAFRTIFYDGSHFVAFVFTFFFFLGLFIGGIVVQLHGSDIADGFVVSSVSGSPNAGNWKPQLTSASFLHGEGSAINENRQRRIWEYKDACYSGSGQPDSRCEIFYQPSIPSVGTPNASCPFGNGACLFGDTGAYERTTGLLDSNKLGINVESSRRVYFRKTMTCSPLVTKGRVIADDPSGLAEYPSEYLYDYGPFTAGGIKRDNYTYRSPMEWLLDTTEDDAFKLDPYVYLPGRPFGSNFKPHPQYEAGDKPVSLFFIRTGGAWFHALESHDPIFPAHDPFILEITKGLRGLFWVNFSMRGGVLACSDAFEICADQSGERCWSQNDIHAALEELKGDSRKQRVLYLVSIALENTYAWRMVHYLQASVLNATREAARIVDIRLAEEQWKVEVDNIFNASLAAVQLQAYDYARGTYAPRPNGPSMTDYTPSILEDPRTATRAAVDISKLFKFKDNEYKNISAFWFWFVHASCLVIFLSSRRFSTKATRDQLIEAGHDGGYHDCLWITIFWHAICLEYGAKACDGIKRVPAQTRHIVADCREKITGYWARRSRRDDATDVENGQTAADDQVDGSGRSVADHHANGIAESAEESRDEAA